MYFQVDVEGFEPKVIQGSTQLIQSRLVKNILMELIPPSENDSAEYFSMISMLVESGFRLHRWGGWAGPRNDVLETEGTAKEVIQRECFDKQKTCNFWWVLEET